MNCLIVFARSSFLLLVNEDNFFTLCQIKAQHNNEGMYSKRKQKMEMLKNMRKQAYREVF